MNNSTPGWDFESDTCVTNQKKPIGPDQELAELLWQNGQVVLRSQTYRKQFVKNDQSTLRTSGAYGNSSNLSQEDESVSWMQHPLEDPLEQEFFSNLLSEWAPCEVESYKPIRQSEEGKFTKFVVASSAPHVTVISSQSPNTKPSCVQEFRGNPMPAPRFRGPDSSQKSNIFGGSQKALNFSHFSAPPNNVSSACANAHFRERVTSNLSQSEAKEYSVTTVGSSHSGSNHIPQDPDTSRVSSNCVWTSTSSAEPGAIKDDVQRIIPQNEKGKLEMLEPTVTSSSGGSGTSLGKTCSLSMGNHGQKRKGTYAVELDEQSEATELKSAIGDKASQQAGSSRRNRAAEVHNLLERRRRDRINEKMRALQQLIPNSNKTDKASMLDEAIEYLKSLQLQLQVMWMGAAGMAPVMFPGIQHYMSQMSMGLASTSWPFIQNPMQLPKVPLDQSISVAQTPNQTVMYQNPILSAFNYQNQMQNPFLSEQYARYMGYHLMQSAFQPINVFRYGSLPVQPSQTMIAPSNSSGPISGATNVDDAVSGKMG